MTNKLLKISCLILALPGLSCGRSTLPDYTRLESLRVVAIKAEPPEITPSATVQLTVLVSDIQGAGRNLHYKIRGCADPGVSNGAVPSCDSVPGAVLLAEGDYTPAAPSYTGTLTPVTLTAPATILESRSPTALFNGTAYLTTIELTAVDGTELKAFKRVIVSSVDGNPVKNANPVITELLANDAAMSVLPAAKASLRINGIEGAAESYPALRNDGRTVTRAETLTTTWFTTDGEFSKYRTEGADAIEYTPPAQLPTGRSVVIIAVVRDGRGGEDFVVRSF